MSIQASGTVTELLHAWSDGDAGALERLTPLVEAEPRRLARDVSPDTVKRDWRLAKFWLLRELKEEAP